MLDISESTHVHIGAGALGLGLVIPALNQLGRTTILINRQTQRSAQKCSKLQTNPYQLLVPTQKESSRTCFEPLANPIGVDFKFIENGRNVLDDLRPTIITTAVGIENLPNVVHYLVDIIRNRMQKNQPDNDVVYVIACENFSRSSTYMRELLNLYAKSDPVLLQYIERNVMFLDSVVDRMCYEPIVTELGVQVNAEGPAEWCIDSTKLNGEQYDLFLRLMALDSQPIGVINGVNVHLRRGKDFDFFEKRKFWLVNGGHLIAAVLTLNASGNRLREGLDQPGTAKIVQQILNIFAYGLGQYAAVNRVFVDEASPERIKEFTDRVYDRMQIMDEFTVTRILSDVFRLDLANERLNMLNNHIDNKASPEATRRVLKDVLSTINIRRFLEKVEERIMEPVMYYTQYSRSGLLRPVSHAPETVPLELVDFLVRLHELLLMHLQRLEL